MIGKKDYVAIPLELRLKKRQRRSRKISKLLTNITIDDITELNLLIYAETKVVCDKNSIP